MNDLEKRAKELIDEYYDVCAESDKLSPDKALAKLDVITENLVDVLTDIVFCE